MPFLCVLKPYLEKKHFHWCFCTNWHVKLIVFAAWKARVYNRILVLCKKALYELVQQTAFFYNYLLYMRLHRVVNVLLNFVLMSDDLIIPISAKSLWLTFIKKIQQSTFYNSLRKMPIMTVAEDRLMVSSTFSLSSYFNTPENTQGGTNVKNRFVAESQFTYHPFIMSTEIDFEIRFASLTILTRTWPGRGWSRLLRPPHTRGRFLWYTYRDISPLTLPPHRWNQTQKWFCNTLPKTWSANVRKYLITCIYLLALGNTFVIISFSIRATYASKDKRACAGLRAFSFWHDFNIPVNWIGFFMYLHVKKKYILVYSNQQINSIEICLRCSSATSVAIGYTICAAHWHVVVGTDLGTSAFSFAQYPDTPKNNKQHFYVWYINTEYFLIFLVCSSYLQKAMHWLP